MLLLTVISGLSILLFTAKPTFMLVPLYASRIVAGFLSPADDYLEKSLDLNECLVQHPAATFFVRVQGHSMICAGIQHGDLLIVDRSLQLKDGAIVIAVVILLSDPSMGYIDNLHFSD